MSLVMGVVNVTPDSFFDGGRWFDHQAAIAHGYQLIAEGADMIDVGGESTRPGAGPVTEEEERRRVVPVIEALAAHVRVSVDTRKGSVAEAAVSVGATLINDVSASLWPIAAANGVGWVAMHMRGEPRTMQQFIQYDHVVEEVRDYLVARAEEARAGGVEEVWIDPGIGFAKGLAHNLELLKQIDQLVATGWPVLVGTSRKSFLGRLARPASDQPAPVDDRLEGSIASAVWVAARGVQMVRVHDVGPTVQAMRIVKEAVTV